LFSGTNTEIPEHFLFSHLSQISAKKQSVQALKFVPDWSIKNTANPDDRLSRSVKAEASQAFTCKHLRGFSLSD
jgi:hypothetical protein